jgi:hypothetical protein
VRVSDNDGMSMRMSWLIHEVFEHLEMLWINSIKWLTSLAPTNEESAWHNEGKNLIEKNSLALSAK